MLWRWKYYRARRRLKRLASAYGLSLPPRRLRDAGMKWRVRARWHGIRYERCWRCVLNPFHA